ncbi:hypothetical protein ACFE04_008023 [Oxalis oulophora]
MLSHLSQICVHFLGSRLFGEKNPVKLYVREGRVGDVQVEPARTGGLVFGGPALMELFKFYNIKIGYIAVFDFINGIDEAKPVIGELSIGHSLTSSLDAGDKDGDAYSLSQQLRFRLASEDKKFRVLIRLRTDSIPGFNSLRIPTVFVRRNMNYDVKPSRYVMKIPNSGRIGFYLEFLIEEASNDDGELVLEVTVFKSDGTLFVVFRFMLSY